MALNKKIVEREGRINSAQSVASNLSSRNARDYQKADNASGVRIRKEIRKVEAQQNALKQIMKMAREVFDDVDYKKLYSETAEPAYAKLVKAMTMLQAPSAISNVDYVLDESTRAITAAAKAYNELSSAIRYEKGKRNGAVAKPRQGTSISTVKGKAKLGKNTTSGSLSARYNR